MLHPVCSVLLLNDPSEYLGDEIRYEFRFCGNLFGFEGDTVLSKRVFYK